MSRMDHPTRIKPRMEWIEMASENSSANAARGRASARPPCSQEAHCSLCGHPFVRGESKAFPFCSSRCQQIDLGQWLDEKLGLPIAGQEEQEFHGFDQDREAESD